MPEDKPEDSQMINSKVVERVLKEMEYKEEFLPNGMSLIEHEL